MPLKEKKLKAILTAMFREGIAKETIQALYSFLINAKQEDLLGVNPNLIAVRCAFDRDAMLNILVRGLLKGLFEMQWEINCPHCKNIVEQPKYFNAVHHHAYCTNCKVEFDNYADENITVTLSLHPDIFSAPLPKIPAMKKLDERVKPMLALELLGLPLFREHFSEQIPRLDQSVKIRSVTVMFTDLIHSTALYSSVGDLSAYALVKEHFDLLFDEVVKNNGGVIKTIGDAVMAVFHQPQNALEAAFILKTKVQKLFSKHSFSGEVGLKIGLSQGTALIVNMNNRLDLFGKTINLAARVVNYSDVHTVAVTDSVYQDHAIRHFIKNNSLKSRKLKKVLKGIPGINDIFLLES